eukprot:SAG31_NODE_3738_length_3934_cov_9.760626_1_plen_67_part_00
MELAAAAVTPATQLFATCSAGLEFVVHAEIAEKIPRASVGQLELHHQNAVATKFKFSTHQLCDCHS